MSQKIKIMLIEDNPAYRDVLEYAFDNDASIELISQFSTAERALRSLQDMSTRRAPDMVLLDLNLPGLTGLETIPLLLRSIPGTRIIILTQSDKEADVLKAISRGAAGYLLKSSTADQIKDGIQSVMEGGTTLDPGVAKYILSAITEPASQSTTDQLLSARELEILTLISEGQVKKEIAEQLNISVTTVIYHVNHIYEKLQVPNAPAAVAKAYKKGIF
jgi:DNA-binding NarL/FixJ family response regulator